MSCLVLGIPAPGRSPGPGAARAARAAASGPATPPSARPTPARPRAGTRVTAGRDTLAACERRLERAPSRLPTMVIVGASFTAGVGPGDVALSWAVLLARMLRWNAVVYGVPGVGYARSGAGGQGPIARMLGRAGLRALAPALVIIQAGHDDSGVPPPIERLRVRQAIAIIHAEAPRARIALLSVFAGWERPSALYQTNDAITGAAAAADRNAIIMNPLGEGWRFEQAPGGLHPTAAGDAWIAAKVAAALRAHGVHPAGAVGSTPVICGSGVSAGRRSQRFH